MSNPTPYKIQVPDEKIKRLQDKLALAHYPDELEEAGWAYGTPLADVKRLAQYWQHGFDWRKKEEELNQYPQFTTKVSVKGFDDIDVHFIHQQSTVPGAIPLLFMHGWPGSYIEVTKLLPLLTNDKDGGPAFHVVAPSLPNFGWSTGTKKKGFTTGKHAEAMDQLMQTLGYSEYVTQGGDIGSFVSRAIGMQFPERCKASHLNMVRAAAPKWSSNPLLALQSKITPPSQRDKGYMAQADWFLNEGSGYRNLQSTKPQTLGYALADSPVALLAWIYEKLHDWTDEYPWTDDEVLTWVSIYYFSTCGPQASVRWYYEHAHDKSKFNRPGLMAYVPHVKLGLSYFPKEIGSPRKLHGQTLGPVVYEAEHDKGGHFAAWECPDIIAKDLAQMFGKSGPCSGIIKGKNGYN